MTNLNPQNSRSLFKKLSDLWAEIDMIDPLGDFQEQGVRLGKIQASTNLANTMIKIFETEMRHAKNICDVQGYSDTFRNPQLKNFDNRSLPEGNE
jgi:hypothetical protein